ncbi:hypothetical protein [Rhodopila sp.]|uniref:hypothetical protein n=1 Tax=Rhodopila sp. TaxID=2480087 RepID=UPI002C026B8B|nr:hypothetical protein [Rhodopila sp.]HVZ06459.1 hypothetical protein [Rhodopila sp.]
MSRFRIGLIVLLACTLPALAAVAGPSEPDLRKIGDMATRLNAATDEQARATIQSTLAPIDPSALAMTFSGPMRIYYDGPKRPDYATVGTVADALGDRPSVAETGVSASVKYGTQEAAPVAGFFDRVDDSGAPQASSRMAERLAEITQLPPGESAPTVRPARPPVSPALPVSPAPPAGRDAPPTVVVTAPAGTVAANGSRRDGPSGASRPQTGGSQSVSPVTVPLGTVPLGTAPSGAASASGGGESSGSAGSAGAMLAIEGQAASPPMRSRSVFMDAAGTAAAVDGPGRVADVVATGFAKRLLAESEYFPGGALPVTRPLSDVFPLSAAAALSMPPQGTGGPPDGVVILPVTVFPAVDEALPVNVRLFRDRLPRLDLEGWLDLMMERIQSLSGPEIVSLAVAAIALFGLAQLWRGRRRLN